MNRRENQYRRSINQRNNSMLKLQEKRNCDCPKDELGRCSNCRCNFFTEDKLKKFITTPGSSGKRPKKIVTLEDFNGDLHIGTLSKTAIYTVMEESKSVSSSSTSAVAPKKKDGSKNCNFIDDLKSTKISKDKKKTLSEDQKKYKNEIKQEIDKILQTSVSTVTQRKSKENIMTNNDVEDLKKDETNLNKNPQEDIKIKNHNKNDDRDSDSSKLSDQVNIKDALSEILLKNISKFKLDDKDPKKQKEGKRRYQTLGCSCCSDSSDESTESSDYSSESGQNETGSDDYEFYDAKRHNVKIEDQNCSDSEDNIGPIFKGC